MSWFKKSEPEPEEVEEKIANATPPPIKTAAAPATTKPSAVVKDKRIGKIASSNNDLLMVYDKDGRVFSKTKKGDDLGIVTGIKDKYLILAGDKTVLEAGVTLRLPLTLEVANKLAKEIKVPYGKITAERAAQLATTVKATMALLGKEGFKLVRVSGTRPRQYSYIAERA